MIVNKIHTNETKIANESYKLYKEAGELFNITLVKEKIQEVTIEEIEKKFGHKIKIVSKKFGE